MSVESAIRQDGAGLGWEEAEGEFSGVVVAVEVVIAAGQCAGNAGGGGPLREG